MFKSILVPLDGSEYSERSLATAFELARMTGAKIAMLTVVWGYKDVHVHSTELLEKQALERAEAYLAPFLRDAGEAGFDVTGQVAHGIPSEEIVKAADEANTNLIVMSTHGIGASGRHALGSVAARVLEDSHCPVLMLRIPEAGPR